METRRIAVGIDAGAEAEAGIDAEAEADADAGAEADAGADLEFLRKRIRYPTT